MYCKHCGKSIDTDSVFCRYCGKPLNENSAEAQNTCVQKDSAKALTHSNSKKIILLFCSCTILLTFIVWGTFSIFNKNKIADITIDKVSRDLAIATKNYDELYGFHEGLAKVYKNKKYGFIDKLGHEIVPCIYDKAEDYHLGISIVSKGEKTGVINQEGDIVIPCKFDDIQTFGKDSLAVACLYGKYGFIDLKGNIVIPFNYEECGEFSEGLAAVRQNGLYGFINKKGELIIPCQYRELYNGHGFNDGLVGVSKDKWGYIDKTGKVVIPFQDGLTGMPFSSGLSIKYRRTTFYDKYGLLSYKSEGAFIHKNGELASDYHEVEKIQEFRDGYSVITDNTGWEGLINRQGDFIIPCKYSFIANGFDDKYVVVRLNDKYGMVHKVTGKVVIPIIYNSISWTFKEGVINVEKDGKMGYINESHQIVIPFIYDGATAFSEGFAVVQRYGKYGYVDRYGRDTFNF